MTSSFAVHLFLYLAIVATSLALRNKKTYIFGAALIGVCLLFLDLPDIKEYKDHYQLAEKIGFYNILALYNFEPGYVALVTISSSIVPFEIFYVIIIALTIDACLKFYCQNAGDRSYIYAALFLSICLYFVAFTIRTTMASMILAYALIYLRNKRNIFAAILIMVGATFHAVIAPMIFLPVINHFSVYIAKRYLLICAAAIFIPLILSGFFPMDSLIGINELADIKILAYKDANINSSSVYFGLWIVAVLGSLISIRRFNEFDRVLVIALVTIIFFLRPHEFIQGRFMWLTSFLFVYVLAKGTFFRFELGKNSRLLLVMTLPLATFLRF